MTIKDIREQLGAYLSKPLPLDTGAISTQQSVSVTSIGAGGVQGAWKFGENGSIEMYDITGNLSIYLGFKDE